MLVNAEGDILYIMAAPAATKPAAGNLVNVNPCTRWRAKACAKRCRARSRNALHQGEPVVLNGPVGAVGQRDDGGRRGADAAARPGRPAGKVLVVFREAALPARRGGASKAAPGELAELELALRQARQALQVAHEDAQASVEELKSATRELQSTNEGTWSANEDSPRRRRNCSR